MSNNEGSGPMAALNKQALIAKIKKQTESFDTVVLKEDEANLLVEVLEAAEKRIAELQARDINIKRQAQALFEAIANPDDCYIPAYVRCLREALNGYCTGIGVKGE